jgi:cytochrome c-type biogenesis protein CcmH/NrfF
MLLLMAASGISASAQTANSAQTVAPESRSALERRLEGEILCTCNCGRPLDSCGMLNCGGHARQTAKLKQFISEGKDHDAIIAAFIADFGSEAVLAAPVDRGFNRLIWLLPYALGFAGAAAVAMMALRWSRERRATAPALPIPADPELESRLDDELRDLD